MANLNVHGTLRSHVIGKVPYRLDAKLTMRIILRARFGGGSKLELADETAVVSRPYEGRTHSPGTFPTVCLFVLGVMAFSGCGMGPAVHEEYRQTGFRVRSDFAAELNADQGWAGAFNEKVTVYTDLPFRIRIEVEGDSGAEGNRSFRLQYRRNGDEWTDVVAEDFPKPETTSPRVSIISTATYENGAATTDLLPGSLFAFRVGTGISLTDTTPSWDGANVHGEWEWPLVIRRFADGAVTNDEGDSFEFRMVDAKGSLLDSYVNPSVTVSVPRGHLGGTFVETPGRIGPWQSSKGDLYFIMEPAETDNLFMMVKSSDEGISWSEVDGANRPPQGDLEGVASELVGHTIHILHQKSHKVFYYSFRTSDHPTHPDSWDVRDELVTEPGVPPTQITSLTARSDGSIVCLYGGPKKIHYKIRTRDGTWGEDMVIDQDVEPDLSGPQSVLGADDVVHLAYTGADGTAWYRRLQMDGTLTPRQPLATGLGTTSADRSSILPMVFIAKSNTAVVIYRLATANLWERRIVDHGPPTDAVQVLDRRVIQDAVDSQQTGADAIADGASVHVLFIEKHSGSIFHTCSHKTAVWQAPTLQVDGIHGNWVRGALAMRGDGARVYAYVYDAGSRGGGGMNRFGEVPLGLGSDLKF